MVPLSTAARIDHVAFSRLLLDELLASTDSHFSLADLDRILQSLVARHEARLSCDAYRFCDPLTTADMLVTWNCLAPLLRGRFQLTPYARLYRGLLDDLQRGLVPTAKLGPA